MVVFSLRKTQKTRPALTECLAIQLCVCFSKTKLHVNTCCPSFAIHPLAEFPSTPRKFCCTCFVMNLHKAMMETSLNPSMCEYNTEESFTTMGWFAWVYIHTKVIRFPVQANGQTYLSGRQEGELFFLRQKYG